MVAESNSTLDSSSASESGHASMEESQPNPSQPFNLHNEGRDHNQNRPLVLRRERGFGEEGTDEENDERGNKVWEAFSNSFREVQMVLDQNRVLIAQVNENHQSKLPDNLTKNVALIREINGNISKVGLLSQSILAFICEEPTQPPAMVCNRKCNRARNQMYKALKP
ncbi:uncharacterized protein LOC143849591 isoform X2 [Tasmannia lanceolata]|uniref:uncharacterized protein LOC143849591 isoform X2 n=1 Tax=Tasmannia lanceolata TaxID=3420 RepID=UPI004063AF4D